MKFFTNLTVAIINLITFRNIIAFVVIILLIGYLAPLLNNSSFKSSANITDYMIKTDFFSFYGLSDSGSIFQNQYQGRDSYNQKDAISTCINGDKTKKIPSCSKRNRCYMLDELNSKKCEQDCALNCRK